MSKHLFTLFFWGFVIYGCASRYESAIPTVSINFNNTVFLNNAACFAPCWQNLRIGISTQSEVIEEISKFNFLNKNGIKTIPQSVPDFDPVNDWVDGENILVSCINRLEPCIQITIANDKLRDIYIKLDHGLLINQAIERFGIPDYVGSHYKGGDVIDCRTEIIWVEQQIILYSIFFTNPEDIDINCGIVDETGVVTATLEIMEVRFLPLEDIKERIIRLSPMGFTGMK